MVVPRLTTNPDIFGVYTVCISLSIFFSYADLGFLTAGQKYAAEYFAQKNLNKEMRVIGFVLFFFGVFMLISSTVLLFLAFNPEILIKSSKAEDVVISSKLLFILAFSSVVVLFQRFNSLVYSIRIEDYIYQSIDVVGNILKIISIQFFITKTNYDIVGYFFTQQIISLLCGIICLYIAVKKYHYNIKQFLSYFRFSNDMYNLTKNLAFSSLLTTIAWILYFELDALILGAYYGVKVVALYAIGFTLWSFLRSLYNAMYSPFLSRFNHFVGNKDEDGLYQTYSFLIKLTFPLCIIPSIVLIFYMENIIVTWVGYSYLPSVLISQLYIITTALSSGLSVPINFLIIAKSQNAILRFNAIILPLLFYSSLIVLNLYIGDKSLVVAKVITIFCGFALILYAIYKILGLRVLKLYGEALKTIIFPIVVMAILFRLFPNSCDIVPKTFNAYFTLSWHMLPPLLLPLAIYYIMEAQTRNFLISKFKSVRIFKTKKKLFLF